MVIFWENCTIKSKLFIGIGAILAIFAVSSAVVLSFVNGLAASADQALANIVPIRALALETKFELTAADDIGGYYTMDRTPSNLPAYLHDYSTAIGAVKDALPKLMDSATTPKEHDTMSALTTWLASYVAANDAAFALKRSGKYDAGVKAFVAFGTSRGQQLIAEFAASKSSSVNVATAEVEMSARAAVVASIVGAVSAILAGIAIAFALGGSISKRLAVVTESIGEVVRVDFGSLTGAMKKFGAGDLSARVDSNRQPLAARGNDETAILARSYNNLLDGMKAFGHEFSLAAENLTRTVTEIKHGSDVVSTSAREIATGNSDLAQRTEEQAASLEETAASMEQLTATVHQNSENAQQANQLAVGASAIAIKGGQVVGEVVQTMSAINTSGKKIVEIISVIDGIAFQTNILALNAAVEAARAGEQGRGFAVVAGEVRTLAQRSAAAAKEIKQLIGESVENTTAGTRLVAQAGDTMAEIVESVKRVTEIMAAIASASVEQGSGIGQVNDAVAQMDKVTQQNAALVEEIAASAVSLEERARGLAESISIFTLTDDLSRSAIRPQPTTPRQVPKSTEIAVVPRPKARAEKVNDGAWSSF